LQRVLANDSVFQRALTQLPPDLAASLWEARGQDRFRKRLWTDSEADYLKAVALNPSHPTLWQVLGRVHDAMGRYDDAAADFARALDKTPGSRGWNSPRSDLLFNLAECRRSYAKLMELRPDDALLWTARARFHALRDEWEQAASDFDHSVVSAPPDSEEWFEYAAARLIIGDDAGYRAFVRGARTRAGGTNDPFVAFTLARMCNLTARPVVEPEQVIRWAELAVAREKRPWYLSTLGMSHYRAGHLDEAIRLLTDPSIVDWGVVATIQTPLILAMVYQRRGESVRARELLDQAERSWQGVERTKIDGAVGLPVTDWLEFQLLRREARALILYDPIFPANPFAR
jgi:tetratricopeptide (TPR) repeat protein